VSQVAGQLLLPEREALSRSWGIPEEAIRRIAGPMSAATDGRYKLVRDASGERLYDLETDPAEASPLPSVGPAGAVRASLAGAIDDTDASAPPSAGIAVDAPGEVAELEERLRTLGYI